MTPNLQQWMMIAVVVAVFLALYLWTRREGQKLDQRLRHPPGE